MPPNGPSPERLPDAPRSTREQLTALQNSLGQGAEDMAFARDVTQLPGQVLDTMGRSTVPGAKEAANFFNDFRNGKFDVQGILEKVKTAIGTLQSQLEKLGSGTLDMVKGFFKDHPMVQTFLEKVSESDGAQTVCLINEMEKTGKPLTFEKGELNKFEVVQKELLPDLRLVLEKCNEELVKQNKPRLSFAKFVKEVHTLMKGNTYSKKELARGAADFYKILRPEEPKAALAQPAVALAPAPVVAPVAPQAPVTAPATPAPAPVIPSTVPVVPAPTPTPPPAPTK